jgi:lipoprotein-releasing system permease protein
MPFEWFVALRYLREDKAQTALVLAAVSVGVAVIVFLSALIGGLQTSLLKQTLGSQPHVVLRTPDEEPRPVGASPPFAIARLVEKPGQRVRSVDQWPRVLADAEAVTGVRCASPTVSGPAFAQRGDAERPISFRGIDPDRFPCVVDVRAAIREGSFRVGGDDVVVGIELARDLGVGPGDKLRVVTPSGAKTLVTVAGVFDLGNKDVNLRWVLGSLRQGQSLLELPGGVTSIELKVERIFEAEAIAQTLAERTGLTADSWMRQNSQLLAGLQAQASSKSMIQFFVVVAVALGIASVLIVSVVQKSKEIGILRAVGTRTRSVSRIFLIQGGVLGFAGSVVGCAIGAALSIFFEGVARNADGSARFPVDLSPSLFFGATILAVLVGLLSAALPARRAGRLDPATAIRG